MKRRTEESMRNLDDEIKVAKVPSLADLALIIVK